MASMKLSYSSDDQTDRQEGTVEADLESVTQKCTRGHWRA